MDVLISGGTGFIGSYLTDALLERGDTVTIISRSSKESKRKGVCYVTWDDDLVQAVASSDAVINLAGSNLFDKRWNDEVRREILESRVEATSALVNAISKSSKKPDVFISGSAVGYYGDRNDEILTEDARPGSDFLANVCVSWESEAKKVKDTRLVIPRIGIVQQKDDGALQKMLLPFKLFAGGPLGSGDQYYPWIHMDDVVGLFLFALDNDKVAGPINIVAPNAPKMTDFAKTLGEVLSRPSFFKVPAFALHLAVGQSAEAILASLRAKPAKATKLGYTFKFPDLRLALKHILAD